MSNKPFNTLRFWKETSNEYIYYCPFCNEKSSHGHLYISKKYPIFNCFKCNCSGHLNKLSNFIHEQCHIEYNNTVEYNLPYLDISKILMETSELLKMYSLMITDKEKEYFRKRLRLKTITMDTIVKFSLFPDNYARKILTANNYFGIQFDNTLRTWTLTGLGSGLSGRAHNLVNENTLRYMNSRIDVPWKDVIDCNDMYFIRSAPIKRYNLSCVPNTLIISEGVYDCCALYLNRKKYGIDDLDSVFIAAQCSNYKRAVYMFQFLYCKFPKHIIIFADIDITPDILEHQFKDMKPVSDSVIFNWPMIKDWEECGPIKHSIEFIRK